MEKILIATHNKAKLAELKLGSKKLKKQGIKIVTLSDLKIMDNPKETGKTLCENSELKAKFYAKISGLPTIADDGGLIIPSLNNEPGVKSRRWLGYEATDKELIDYALKRLNGYLKEYRVAYLEACLCFYNPETRETFSESEKIKGYIAQKPNGRAPDGYPFHSLFIVEKFDKYYGELTPAEHEKVNHRLIALKRLFEKIGNYLIK